MVALAATADVEALLGRSLTPEESLRVDAILVKASELFRLEARQQFTPGTSTQRLRVIDGSAHLPQRPVVSVTTVQDDGGVDVAGWSLSGYRLIVPLESGSWANVTYDHGASPVPDLVRTTVADVARKVLEIDPKAAQGVSQFGRTTGPFSDQLTYATWAQGGQTMLAPDDRAIARSYRPARSTPVLTGGY